MRAAEKGKATSQKAKVPADGTKIRTYQGYSVSTTSWPR